MVLSKENLTEINQPNDFVSESIELSPEALAQLERLLDLLIDLKILDPIEKPSQYFSDRVNPTPSPFLVGEGHAGRHPLKYLEAAIAHSENPQVQQTLLPLPAPASPLNLSTANSLEHSDDLVTAIETLPQQQPQLLLEQTAEAVQLLITSGADNLTAIETLPQQQPELLLEQTAEATKSFILSEHNLANGDDSVIPVERLENLAQSQSKQEQAEYPEHNLARSDDLNTAFKRLQNILVEPEVSELRNLVNSIEWKIANLQGQISEPKILTKLLMSLISKLLRHKIAEAQEPKQSIVEAIAPAIDEAIQVRNRENKVAMGVAIAPAIATAISEQVRNSPAEIGTAIATAIKEQVRNSPSEIALAIAPVMAAAIKKQIELERDAMVDALSPIVDEVFQKNQEDRILILEQKLKGVEHQLYNREALVMRLVPVIADIVSGKVAESRESVADAIAPIIDEVIENRNQENKIAMGEALAPAIPVAISHQMSASPDEIAHAIAPEMAAAIKQQIRLQKDAMADALYPIIGSTVSKYIADALESINEKLETALSVEGASRKIRAKMQGVSEAELLLKESMPFKIKAIFLIHKGSGLVISEAQSGSEKLESDMLAAMLTAIRSFVNDCIAQSGDISEIDEIEYGNSKIILEVAGYCYLAVVTQGEPPKWFIHKMRHTMVAIGQDYGDKIELFEGDTATIPQQVNLLLEELINISLKVRSTKKPYTLLIGGLAILSLILVPWGFFQYRKEIDRRIETVTANALASAPELSVYRLSVDADNGTLKLFGLVPNQYLRAKAEQIALKAAPGLKLDSKIIAVEVPADPVLAAAEVKRVTAMLNQTDGVTISSSYANNKVTVRGSVSQWGDANKITAAFAKIPGVKSVTNTVQLQQLAIGNRIYFEPDSAKLKTVDIDTKIIQIKKFLNRYPEKLLRIVGHSYSPGDTVTSQQLALQRAKVVQNALVKQGIDRKRLQVAGTTNSPVGVDYKQPLWLSRCVEFEQITTGLKRK